MQKYQTMTRQQFQEYLRKLGFNLDFIEDFMPMIKDPTINLVQIRFGKPSGCTGYRTNNIEYCMEKYIKALTEWVELKE